jgi:hypothetical protein
MNWRLILGSLVVVITLAAGTSWLAAQDPQAQRPVRDWAEALAAKLNLTEQQKEQFRTIHKDFDAKADPLRQEIWSMHHQEREQMTNVLNEKQRAELPTVLQNARAKEFQEIATQLGLSDAQRQKIQKIQQEYGQKFHDLAGQQGANAQQFRDLRHEAMQAVLPELTEDQRARFPMMVGEEIRKWSNPEFRQTFWKNVGEQLGLDADQKQQIDKIHTDFAQQLEKPVAQLRELHRQQHAAIKNVLTADQKTKLEELRKGFERK